MNNLIKKNASELITPETINVTGVIKSIFVNLYFIYI